MIRCIGLTAIALTLTLAGCNTPGSSGDDPTSSAAQTTGLGSDGPSSSGSHSGGGAGSGSAAGAGGMGGMK
jgi:hypothetical protein